MEQESATKKLEDVSYIVTPEKPKNTPIEGTLEAIRGYNINQ